MTFHLFNRDLANLIEVFVNHVYDKYCEIRSGDLVIDCGAYVGEFTIQAAKNVGERGLVLAFEPNPSSFCFCKANVDRNRIDNVKLFEHALGDTDGREYLQVNRVNLGASKVIQEETQGSVGVVRVKMLSQFLPYFEGRPVKLLKIDVEGSAVQVARGATNLFDRRQIQNISAEIHPGEEGLRSLLESYGFTCSQEKSYLYAKL
jgi:FkbM family methyltransferase